MYMSKYYQEKPDFAIYNMGGIRAALSKGDVTYGELGDYIAEHVSQESIVSNGKSQTPTVSASQTVAATWKTMKLR